MEKILVISEHEGGRLRRHTLSAVAFAAKVAAESGGRFEILVLGEGMGEVAGELRSYGAAAVLVGDHADLRHPVADKHGWMIARIARERGATMVVAAASTFSKDILPRSAALMDAGMLSDVVGISMTGGEAEFKRIMFAGNVIATVKLDGAVRFLTVRSAAFVHPVPGADVSPVVELSVPVSELPSLIEYGSREVRVTGRPDPTEARVVVSGGRGVKNAEDFERLIGGLADAFGGAAGSSRALVDAGIVPNSLQVGQTGKIVAPDLYVAVGISGAIQHMAGMKDTKVIVAINKDPDAPIFEVADFGIVGDAYQLVPELIEKVKAK